MRINSGVQVNDLGRRIITLVERYYPSSPKLYITSAYRPADSGSHHSGLTYNGSPTAAVDFGAYDLAPSRAEGQQEMRTASLWLFDNFWDLTVELIHTNPTDEYYTYVKNQHKVGAYAAADHVNHIHWATSASLMTQIEARAAAKWGGSSEDRFLPLPAGHWFGDINGPVESHGGHPSASPHDKGYIQRIQEQLTAVGYNPGSGDGVFGSGTIDAVKRFQAANGLQVDGRVNRTTWERLFPVKP